MGFGQGVSGINAASQNLDVIGNNIANANTVGFKQSTAQFADIYAGSKVGLGTRVNSVVQSFTQGNIESTGRAMDVAITGGNGFFRMVSTDGQVYFSRNGQFQRTDDGRLVNAQGLQVTGYPAGATAGGGVQPQPLVISNAQMPPKATDGITAQYNLDSRSKDIDGVAIPFNPTNSASFTYSSTIEVYDSLGNAQQVGMYFAKRGDNDWDMYIADANGAVLQGPTEVTFTENGQLDQIGGAAAAPFTLAMNPGNGAAPMSMTVNLAGTTQFGDDNDPKVIDQTGYGSGSLLGFTIEKDGTIRGSYSNEQTMSLGQIVLATFGNVEGLNPEGDNVWSATGSSGQALLAAPGGSMGSLQSSAVEASNVDLSAQLVSLIIAQRNYQANAKTIEVQSEVASRLVNI